MSSSPQARRRPPRGKNRNDDESADLGGSGKLPASTEATILESDSEAMQGIEMTDETREDERSQDRPWSQSRNLQVKSTSPQQSTQVSSSIRAPPQRLASLHSRTGGVIASQQSLSPPTSPKVTAAAAVAAERRPQPLKFKPKSFIRRSAAEREAVERAEAERRHERHAAEHRTINSHGRPGRGGPDGRGRGGGLVAERAGNRRFPTDRFQPSRHASGVLGGAEIRERVRATREKRDGNVVGNDVGDRSVLVGGTAESVAGEGGKGKGKGREKGSKSGTKVKPEIDRASDVNVGKTTSKTSTKGKSARQAKVKKEDDVPRYASVEEESESDAGEKINIEYISILSSEDEEHVDNFEVTHTAKGKQRENPTGASKPKGSWMMRPVLIERQDHIERTVGVNTEASSLPAAELRKRAKEREATGKYRGSDEEDANMEVLSNVKPGGRRKPKDVEFVKDERKWKGVWERNDTDEGSGEVRIKSEYEEGTETLDPEQQLGSSFTGVSNGEDPDDDFSAEKTLCSPKGLQVPDNVRSILKELGVDDGLDEKLGRGELPQVPGYTWKKEDIWSDFDQIGYVHALEDTNDHGPSSQIIPWKDIQQLPEGYEWRCETQCQDHEDETWVSLSKDLPSLPPGYIWYSEEVSLGSTLEDDLIGWEPVGGGFHAVKGSINGQIRNRLETGDEGGDFEAINTALAEIRGLRDDYMARNISAQSSSTVKPTSASSKPVGTKDNSMLAQQSYIVQLPPLVPSLRDALTKPQSPKAERHPKVEPTTVPTNPFNTHPKDAASIDPEHDDPAHVPGIPEPKIYNAYTQTSSGLSMTSGHVGTLTFLENGQTLASWGFGQEKVRFEISTSGNTGFLSQEVLVTEYERTTTKVEESAEWEEIVKIGGEGREAMAMGRVSGGFVGVPDWGDLL